MLALGEIGLEGCGTLVRRLVKHFSAEMQPFAGELAVTLVRCTCAPQCAVSSRTRMVVIAIESRSLNALLTDMWSELPWASGLRLVACGVCSH